MSRSDCESRFRLNHQLFEFLIYFQPPTKYRKYRLGGDIDVTKYFNVDSSAGQIRVALPLYDDAKKQYTVSSFSHFIH